MYKVLFFCSFVQVFGVFFQINPLNSIKYEYFDVVTRELTPESLGNLDGVTIIVKPSAVASEVQTIANFSVLSLVFENEQDDVPDLKRLSNLISASIRCFRCRRLKNTTLNTVRLRSINLSGNNLSRIETGSFGADLEYLVINDNRLTEFSSEWFQNVSNLKDVNISRNLLSALPEFQATKLNLIDFSHNNIENVTRGILASPVLKTIFLNKNKITRIDENAFGGHVAIVDLADNLIRDTKLFRKAVNLTDLNMENNILVSLPDIKHCRKLKRLNLAYNRIEEISLNRIPDRVEEINLMGNSMTTIEGTFGENVVKVNLDRNRLRHAKYLFINAIGLEVLTLSENWNIEFPLLENCTKLKTVECFLSGIKELKKIYLKGTELEYVKFPHNHIERIEPDTFGPFVRYLDLSSNILVALNRGVLNEPCNLVELKIGWNHMKVFPHINRCGKLKRLYLEVNRLEYITAEMFENTSISVVDLSSNEISRIETDAFGPHIKYLNLNYNKLTGCSFETIEDLEELHVGHNNLSVVPHLNNCKNLKILYISSNLITRLNNNVFNSIALEDINLNNNRIVDIQEGAFSPTVKIINLAGNQLIDPANSFRNLTNLRELQMQHNELTSIPNLNDCSDLQSLNVYNNKIRKLRKGIFDKTPLKHLNAAQNSISQLEAHPFGSNIQEIDIENNKLEDIADLILNATNLQNLQTSHNLITSLPIFRNNKKLLKFIAHQNNITHLQEKTFGRTSLELIDLEDNLISKIDAAVFGNSLKTLILSKNKIKTVSDDWFSNKTVLERLDLSDNQITHVPPYLFKDFVSLVNIDLSHNEIRSIGRGAFARGNYFETLYLHRNRLFEIDPNVFSDGVIDFVGLSLSENRISFLSGGFLSKIKPKVINIFENPWQCACWDEAVRWWRKFNTFPELEHAKTKVYDENSRPVCASTGFDYCINQVDYRLIDVFENNKLL